MTSPAPLIDDPGDLSALRLHGDDPDALFERFAAWAQAGGTAPKAQALGYSVGGKTGTAHKQEGRGYAGNKYRAWFVGIAPISQPRIVVAARSAPRRAAGGSSSSPSGSGTRRWARSRPPTPALWACS